MLIILSLSLVFFQRSSSHLTPMQKQLLQGSYPSTTAHAPPLSDHLPKREGTEKWTSKTFTIGPRQWHPNSHRRCQLSCTISCSIQKCPNVVTLTLFPLNCPNSIKWVISSRVYIRQTCLHLHAHRRWLEARWVLMICEGSQIWLSQRSNSSFLYVFLVPIRPLVAQSILVRVPWSFYE